VWSHLVALHFYLDRGFDGDKTRLHMKRFVERSPELTWLPPPDFAGTLNVNHVLAAVDSQDHVTRAKEWATSVYSCWQRIHRSEIEGMVHKVLG
jgi:hypothetical protein